MGPPWACTKSQMLLMTDMQHLGEVWLRGGL